MGHTYLAIYGYTPAREAFPRAREFARKALDLDPTLAEPHMTLGLILFLQDHDIEGWEREQKRALELNPTSTDAHRLNGLRLIYLSKFEEGIAEVKRALEIEPLSIAGNINYAYGLFYSGRIDEGEAQTRKAIELSPEFWMSHYYLYNVYRYKRNYAEALEEVAKAKELRGEPEVAKLLRESFAKSGWQGFLRYACANPQLKFYQYDLATFYAELGDKDNAFAKLNQSIEDREQFIGFVNIDPFLKSLHDDPRYLEVLKKIGFR